MAKYPSFSEQLRAAVAKAPQSRYRIANDLGIPEANLSRFARGHAGLSLENLDKLCEYLGLRLASTRRTKNG